MDGERASLPLSYRLQLKHQLSSLKTTQNISLFEQYVQISLTKCYTYWPMYISERIFPGHPTEVSPVRLKCENARHYIENGTTVVRVISLWCINGRDYVCVCCLGYNLATVRKKIIMLDFNALERSRLRG